MTTLMILITISLLLQIVAFLVIIAIAVDIFVYSKEIKETVVRILKR